MALDRLLSLGEALRLAQSEALAGADAAELRRAGRARRDAVVWLAESAVGLLAERGPEGATHYDEIAATLEAACLDAAAAAEVSSGRLTSSLRPPAGFGDLDPATGPEATGEPRPVAKRCRRGQADAETTEIDGTEKLARAERAASDAAAVASDLATKAREAAGRAADRKREVADAEADETRLQRELDEARGRVTAERRGADRAQRAAESAEEAADTADARRREAAERVDALRARGRPTPSG